MLIVTAFALFFFLQIKYIKSQLTELELVNKFLYSHLLEGQFNERILSPNEINFNESQGVVFFEKIDSIITSRIQFYYSSDKIDYIIADEHDSSLYSPAGNKGKTPVSVHENPYFFEAARFVTGSGTLMKIMIPDTIKRQNEIILLFYKLLWVVLCVVSLGFMIFIWEKQRKMQKIRLDVINNMSHEFKTPLTSIQLVSEMIMQQGTSMREDKLKQYAGIIHQESNKMLQQATQILNSAYYDQSKFVLRNRNHNIHGLIDYVLNTYILVYSDKEIHISKKFNASNPVIAVDRNHFVNVMTNLLDNARKYAKGNHVNVTVSTHNEGSRLLIEVEDDGIGIEAKYQKMVFDRFYRVPSGNVHDKSGYGVGLFYVKTILSQMNADIRVKSRLGHGSVFILQFKSVKSHA